MIMKNTLLLRNLITSKKFAARLAQANLASKNDIAAFVKKINFDDKIKNLNKKVTSNKLKHLVVENELKNQKHLNQVFLLVKATFISDGAQLYLIFQPLHYTLARLDDTERIVSQKSKGLSTETRTTPTTSDNSFAPSTSQYAKLNIRLVFEGSCFK